MKLPKIISKNFKVLLRSKSSALVVILGPLILILLVGLSFSNSSTFTLKIGVFSSSYNDLTESYIQKLQNEDYKITRYVSEQECIENIKNSGAHICIIFPANFEIRNDKSNEIKFYIDQTKQNFVYAVINTVTSSFSERSSELSLDMTTRIINAVSRTRNTAQNTKDVEIATALETTDKMLERSSIMQTKLSGNAVDTSSVSTSTGDLSAQSNVLRLRITDQYTTALDLLNLSNVIFDEAGSSVNASYGNMLEDYGSTKGYLYKSWNDTIAAKDKFVNTTNTITSSVTTLIKNVDSAKEIDQEVVAELKNGVDQDLTRFQGQLDTMSGSMDSIVSDINSLQVTSAENIVSPIVTTIETVTPEKSHLDYLFPSLIVLLIMMISILLSSTLVIMEKNSKAYFRNFTTPTNDIIFILSTFLTGLFMMIIQITVVLMIAGFVFKTGFAANIFIVGLLVIIISSLFVLLGMLVGYLFNTEQTGMIGAISLSSVMLLTSDIILPLENMPAYVQQVAKYNPFVVASEALKKSIIFSSSLEGLKQQLLILGIMILTVFIVIVFIEKLTKARFFNKFALYRKKIVERPENIREIFRIDGHLVKDQKELYRFIKGLRRREFKNLVFRRTNRVADFALEALQDQELAHKLTKMRTRWGVLLTIEKHNSLARTLLKEDKSPKKEKAEEKKETSGKEHSQKHNAPDKPKDN